MNSRLRQLYHKGYITPPKFLPSNLQYEVIMGSQAYGVSSDNSDLDIYGFCIPPKDDVFPHLRGEIPGFGRQKQRFEQYQQHHINYGDTEYDFQIYSIVKYFNLLMENNPNVVDSLFVPNNCVLHETPIAQHIRENRRLFLHKGSWYKFKGYAYSQYHKMQRNPEGKRKETVEKYGYDVKFAYHVFRLLDEIEQILTEGDIDLQRNREQLKAIRRGDMSFIDIAHHFKVKEHELEELYHKSDVIPHKPDEQKIKALLLECLEQHYGSLDNAVVTEDRAKVALEKIESEAYHALRGIKDG